MEKINDLTAFLSNKNYQIKQIKLDNLTQYIAFKTHGFNRWLLIHICNDDFMKSINRNYEFCCISNDETIWAYSAVTSVTEKNITDYINLMIKDSINNSFCRENTYISDDNEYNNYLFEFFRSNGYSIL